ncbi:MAG: ATP-binding protein [Anaerolineae bacterium]
MENTKINTGQAEATLSELLRLIRERRESLAKGRPPNGLVHDMVAWEAMLQRLQTEMLLEKSAEINLLYEVSNSINASLDWRRTIQAVMGAVIRITQAERGILLYFDDENCLQVGVTSSAGDASFTETDLQLSYSIVEQALQRGRPILTTNAQVDPRFRQSDSIVAYGLRSILCAPLIHQGQPLGVIYLDNRARAGVFTQEDLAMLTAFADQASTAVAHAHEYRKADEELAERVKELTILQEMTRDLSTNLRFDRVMDRSVSWALAAASAEAGAVALVAEEGLRWVATLGNVQPDTAFSLRSVHRREPLIEPERIAVPLLRDERPIGALYLVAHEQDLSEEKIGFVRRVADNIAIAVENARLYEALRQANQAKSEFVSLVSHELRTPMTSIRGYADMLHKGMAGELAPQQREFVGAIRRNATRMRILVSDLLDISRIETGRLKLKIQPTNLNSAIAEATHTLEEMAQEKSHTFSLNVMPEVPEVFADPDRLTQVLINLLSNAVKYTEPGGEIHVSAWTDQDEPSCVQCAVADTGIGIKPEDQLHLFTKFFRADSPEVRDQPGTGLGLAIAKSLVEMQGGRIWLKSRVGEGTTFYFTVPTVDNAAAKAEDDGG